jgi:hypothetical protein
MAERIDILMPQVDAAPTFTVNNAVNSVDLVPNPAGTQVMYAGANVSKFQRGDSFIILSCGYFIPEGFRIYGYEEAGLLKWPVPILLLTGRPAGGGIDITINSFGNNGQLRVPFPNYEFSIGTFCDPEADGFSPGATFELKEAFPYVSGIDSVQVSMINVPAALNGVIFKVIPWVKVLHNFPLTA